MRTWTPPVRAGARLAAATRWRTDCHSGLNGQWETRRGQVAMEARTARGHGCQSLRAREPRVFRRCRYTPGARRRSTQCVARYLRAARRPVVGAVRGYRVVGVRSMSPPCGRVETVRGAGPAGPGVRGWVWAAVGAWSVGGMCCAMGAGPPSGTGERLARGAVPGRAAITLEESRARPIRGDHPRDRTDCSREQGWSVPFFRVRWRVRRVRGVSGGASAGMGGLLAHGGELLS